MLNRIQAPSFSIPSKVELPIPSLYTCANNYPIYTFNSGTQPILCLTFCFAAGSSLASNPLIASFANRFLLQGTTTKNSKELIEALDFYGAYIQQDTDSNYSTIKLFTLEKHLQPVLTILEEIFTSASFPEEDCKILINNAIDNYTINQQKVKFVGAKAFKETLLKGSIYGESYDIETYKNLQVQEIKQFAKQHYSFGNGFATLAGAYKPESLSIIDSICNKMNTTNTLPTTTIPTPINKPSKIVLEIKDSLQSSIHIGSILPSINHPDYTDLVLLIDVLGGYFGSRLMTNVREDKGYTYGIHSYIVTNKDFSYLQISTDVSADVRKAAVEEIYKEIQLLQTSLIPKEELEIVRNYMIGSFLRSIDSSFRITDKFMYRKTVNADSSYQERYWNSLLHTTPEQLQNLARKYFNIETLTEVIAGQ